MKRGSKKNYSPKQRKQAHHIEQSETDSGRSKKDAERIGWSTVNKQTGGTNKKKSSERH
jgi:hypothetical protein